MEESKPTITSMEALQKLDDLLKKEKPKELVIEVTYKGKRVKGTCIGFNEKTREVKVRLDQYDGEVVSFIAKKDETPRSIMIKNALKPKRKQHGKRKTGTNGE